MAVLISQITIGEKLVLILDDNPSSGAGYAAALGSLAIVDTTGALYIKIGATDTDWTLVLTANNSAEEIQDAIAAALTDSADIDFTYDDLLNQISAVLTVTAVTPGAYGSATAVGSFTVDSKGRLTAAADVPIAIPSTQVTDFVEAAQDAVFNAITDSSTIDVTYNDAGNSFSLAVIPGGIDHGALADLLADDHTQYLLLAGRTGGQSANGGTAASDNLTLSSTANVTKGKVLIGTYAAFDEANSRLGLGTQSPSYPIHTVKDTVETLHIYEDVQTVNAADADLVTYAVASGESALVKAFVRGRNAAGGTVTYERSVQVKNVSGTVTIGAVQSDYTNEDAGMGSANATFVVSGTNLILRVSGVNSQTIDWKAEFKAIR